MNVHHFDPTILRAYDIRGIFEDTLTGDDAFAIGLAFITMQRQRGHGEHIAVGRDGRLSSPALAAALIDGLVAGGASVSDIGCGPTPMLYYAAHELATGGAIQITGSHNPPTHNGFKMVLGGQSFFGPDIKALGQLSAEGIARREGGKVNAVSVTASYVDRLCAGIDTAGVSAIWDCGNGASGPVTEMVTKRLAGTHKVLFSEIDGTFPNHHPNPVDPETLDMLRAEVSQAGADIGIGFDGDGDRIGVIDAKGRQVPGDLLTAFLAQDIGRRHAGSPILLDVKSSDSALHLIAESGAIPEIWKTGHSHMKQRIKAVNAPLAGEMSGHIFIADDYYGFDDALYAGLRVLSQTVKFGQTITQFMDALPVQHATPELRIDCPDTLKFGVMDKIQNKVTTAYAAADISVIDGVRVRSQGGWWLLRASNTEAALVARAEAETPETLASLIGEITTTLKAAGLDWTFA